MGQYTYKVSLFSKASAINTFTSPRGTLEVLGLTINTDTNQIALVYCVNSSVTENEKREVEIVKFQPSDNTDYLPGNCVGVLYDPATSAYYAAYLKPVPIPDPASGAVYT